MSLPFELKIPTTALVTNQARNGKIYWTLSAVLARRMRSDTKVEEELYEYSSPKA